MANFFESVSKNRMITLVLALVGFSVLVFVAEEYAEESDYDGDYNLKQSGSFVNKVSSRPLNPPPTTSTNLSDDCYKTEPFVILQKCIACSEFETSAIKSKHCLPSGYFDRLNCTTSGHIVFRPCTKVRATQSSSFYRFVVFNGILLTISYIVATKRREFLERTAYIRVQQQFS